MFQRIAAISAIFLCTAFAWMILGTTIFTRTYRQDPGLRSKVVSSWGGKHTQAAPRACYFVTEPGAGKNAKPVKTCRTVPLEGSRVEVRLNLEHRQKGLLWYSTYTVQFGARYTFRNTSDSARELRIEFPLPSKEAIYDDLVLQVNGRSADAETGESRLIAHAAAAQGQTAEVSVSYRSQGLEAWQYSFGGGVSRVRGFELRALTNFAAVDFPPNTLSPTAKRRERDGWELRWNYGNLMSGQQIGIAMPEKLQPGLLAGQISYFAPVSLLFFFFVMFIVTTLRRIELHPMNYFFLAAAFFAFHLLLAYLVDHIDIHRAFAVASAVSVFLVVSYLRLVTGLRFAAVEAAFSQFLYLVLFSYAFFFRGFTGLAVTIGSIDTLFVAS